MSRALRLFGFVALLVVLPALAADDAKKDGDKKDAEKKPAPPTVRSPLAPPERKEVKYQEVQKFTGKMQKVDQSDRILAVEIARLNKRETHDFALADDVKVRTNFLPPQSDEKGRPKKYTAEEKHKLKGDDPKLPGYAAELSALAKGQVIEVHLSRLKSTAAKKPAPSDKDKVMAKDKAKDKEADKDKAVDRDVMVTMIVILTQDNPPPSAKPGKK